MSRVGGPPPAASFCNIGPSDLLVWIEPWCDEILLPARSQMTLVVTEGQEVPAIEPSDEHVTVWAGPGTRLRIDVDGVVQDTASNCVAVPGLGSFTTRGFVDLVFGGFPEARPGGLPLAPVRESRTYWGRLFGWLKR